jgi:putative flippase GtrA
MFEMPSRRFIFFCAAGAIGFAVDGGLMVAISTWIGLTPMQARPFSFAVAVTVTWWLNRRYTFSARTPPGVGEWAKYAATNVVGALVNLAVFYLIMLVFPPAQRYPLAVLAVAAGVALVSNFAGSQWLVFRQVSTSRPARPGTSNGVVRNG